MKKTIKRHFYNGRDYILDTINKEVKLTDEFHKKLLDKKLWGRFGFKKIGGSSIGDVLEVNPFGSRFIAFCRLSWIGLPILDRKYVDAGVAIEPKVVKAIEKMTKQKVETYPPEKYQFDFFKDVDPILGGLPDGFIEKKGLVIEIKTTGIKKMEQWTNNNPPIYYIKQVQLYAYLMKMENYAIVAAFLEEGDYTDPGSVDLTKRHIKTFSYNMNKEQAEDDVKVVKDWYKDVTASGVSPKYSHKTDPKLIEWLKCENEEQWLELKDKWITKGVLVE